MEGDGEAYRFVREKGKTTVAALLSQSLSTPCAHTTHHPIAIIVATIAIVSCRLTALLAAAHTTARLPLPTALPTSPSVPTPPSSR